MEEGKHLLQAKHPVMPGTECWSPANSVLVPCAKLTPDHWLNQMASGQLK